MLSAMPISEELKAKIRASGLTMGELSRGSGVAQPILSRFLSDDPDQHRDIRLERTADKLAAYFGLVLAAEKPQPKPKAKKKPRPKEG
jgi:predicted transcriptional regulator